MSSSASTHRMSSIITVAKRCDHTVDQCLSHHHPQVLKTGGATCGYNGSGAEWTEFIDGSKIEIRIEKKIL